MKGAFLSDMLIGLGINEAFARRQYATEDRTAISLEDKMAELKFKLTNHQNTFGQYITQQNLFLVISFHSVDMSVTEFSGF